MIREVERLVNSMKWRKSEGSDGVVVEIVEAAEQFAINKITNLANAFYKTKVEKRVDKAQFGFRKVSGT